jgi:hypothetical protein
MDRFRFAMVVVAVLTGTGLAATPTTLAAARAGLRAAAVTPVNVDISGSSKLTGIGWPSGYLA